MAFLSCASHPLARRCASGVGLTEQSGVRTAAVDGRAGRMMGRPPSKDGVAWVTLAVDVDPMVDVARTVATGGAGRGIG
jgi:hypothetical protein